MMLVYGRKNLLIDLDRILAPQAFHPFLLKLLLIISNDL